MPTVVHQWLAIIKPCYVCWERRINYTRNYEITPFRDNLCRAICCSRKNRFRWGFRNTICESSTLAFYVLHIAFLSCMAWKDYKESINHKVITWGKLMFHSIIIIMMITIMIIIRRWTRRRRITIIKIIITWLWRWLPHWLWKRQSTSTVLFRTSGSPRWSF